jgi:ferric-dicitrate binding protein FerR (iron transport regulator)
MFASAAAASLIVAGALVVHRTSLQPRQDQAVIPVSPSPRASERILRLADGSTAAPLDAETEIELVEQHPDRVALSLLRGRGRFEVTPQPRRTFLVRAGDVTVAVVGTAFTVERVADRVGVAVLRGTVEHGLRAGDRRKERVVPAARDDGRRRSRTGAWAEDRPRPARAERREHAIGDAARRPERGGRGAADGR